MIISMGTKRRTRHSNSMTVRRICQRTSLLIEPLIEMWVQMYLITSNNRIQMAKNICRMPLAGARPLLLKSSANAFVLKKW